MSIWNRDIFGRKEVQKTPPSERAIRCLRLRVMNDARLIRVAMFVKALIFGGVFAAAAVSILILDSSLPTAPGSKDDFWSRHATMAIGLVPSACFVVMAIVMPGATRKHFDKKITVWTDEKIRKRKRQRRWWAGRWWMVAGAVIVVVGSIGAIEDWRNPVMMLTPILAIAGVEVVAMGLFARRGRALLCARCEYPMRSWRLAAERCPECGCGWRQPWELVAGRRGVRWDYALWGIGTIGMAGLMVVVLTLGR